MRRGRSLTTPFTSAPVLSGLAPWRRRRRSPISVADGRIAILRSRRPSGIGASRNPFERCATPPLPSAAQRHRLPRLVALLQLNGGSDSARLREGEPRRARNEPCNELGESKLTEREPICEIAGISQITENLAKHS